MEMTAARVTDRLICAEALVDVKNWKARRLADYDKKKAEKAIQALNKLPITIVDGQWSTAEIKSKIMQEQLNGLDLVIIDFLTRINEPRRGNMSTHDLVGGVAQRLQSIAINLNVPILTLAQLSRGVEKRENKKPVLSDLRESGNIEEACDKVLFIYREEYYNKYTKNAGVAEIIIAKNRDGPIGTREIAFIDTSATFRDLARR
jgi:replicative DNA helicase